MKQKMIITVVAVLAVLVGFSGRALAREAQPGDDHGGFTHKQSTLFMLKNGLTLTEDRGLSGHGADDLPGDDRSGLEPGDDRGLSGHGADDLPGDDRGGLEPGDDRGGLEPGDDRGALEPGDDRGLPGQGADDLPGDDRGGATPITVSPATVAPTSPSQPADDHGGSGHGGDDLSGDDKGGSTLMSSPRTLGMVQPVLGDSFTTRWS